MLNATSFPAVSLRDGARNALLRAASILTDETSTLFAEDEALALALMCLEDWRTETLRADLYLEGRAQRHQ